MCSILGIFDLSAGTDLAALRSLALAQSAKQRHRGPDWSGVYTDPGAVLVHERLAIVDPAGGAQPLRSADGRLALAVNGEIYNHRELERDLKTPYEFQSGSDCEVINALYLQEGAAFLSKLNGIYAFCLWNAEQQTYLIARDPLGVCPLYQGRDSQGRLWIASEMKALVDVCDQIEVFPPGHYLDSREGVIKPFWQPQWRDYEKTKSVKISHETLRTSFEQAVHRQMMTDVPYGVLLSGGLDSSLVAACAMRFARQRVEEDDKTEAWWPRLHSFAIGLEGSPDLAAAHVAAEAIGTIHHSFKYTVQEGLDAIPEVIRHVETYVRKHPDANNAIFDLRDIYELFRQDKASATTNLDGIMNIVDEYKIETINGDQKLISRYGIDTQNNSLLIDFNADALESLKQGKQIISPDASIQE